MDNEQALYPLKDIFEELNDSLRQTEEFLNEHFLEYSETLDQDDEVPELHQSARHNESETQSASDDIPEDERYASQGIAIETSEDNLEAYLYFSHTETDGISMDFIKKFLETEGIRHGIIKDEDIKQYIADPLRWTKPCLVAQATLPQEITDYDIHYYFETDPIKIGTERTDGSIDFKQRGKLPYAKKGELLAEKLSGKTGYCGIDIYGNEIPVPKPKKIDLYCGKGVQKSPDGLKLYATVEGQPGVSANGKIFVLPEMNIAGDIGLETGHVDFDGHISVQGTVKSGFNVKSGSLTAQEIEKCQIETEGNVTVYGGISGANIKTFGSVKADHLHLSNIEALGNVSIENEICNSRIDINGKLVSKWGQIINSFISAKQGIEAQDIGSDVSRPCTLVIGNDCEKKQQRLKEMKEQLYDLKEKHEPLIRNFIKLSEFSDNIRNKIEKQSKHIQSLIQQKAFLKAKFQQFQSTLGKNFLSRVLTTLRALNIKIEKEEEFLESLIRQKDNFEKKFAAYKFRINSIKSEFNELQETIKSFIAVEKGQEIPMIKVSGKIFDGTLIRGENTTYTFKNTCQRLKMKELKVRDRKTKEAKWIFVKQHIQEKE